MEFQFYLSARVMKFFGLKPAEVPKDSLIKSGTAEMHWCSTWRIEMIGSSGPNLHYFMTMNLETRYALLLQYSTGGISKLLENWERRLFDTFQNMGVSAPDCAFWSIAIMRGNPRVLIGSMNDQITGMLGCLERDPECPLMLTEEFLNHTPFVGMKGIFPDQTFAKKLKEAPPFSGHPSKKPKIIPFRKK